MTNDKKQLEEEMKVIGQRLALLLEVADIPEDQKAAWEMLLPEMSVEQIFKLIEYLELKVPDVTYNI